MSNGNDGGDSKPFRTTFEWDDGTKALRVKVGFAPGEVWDLYYKL